MNRVFIYRICLWYLQAEIQFVNEFNKSRLSVLIRLSLHPIPVALITIGTSNKLKAQDILPVDIYIFEYVSRPAYNLKDKLMLVSGETPREIEISPHQLESKRSGENLATLSPINSVVIGEGLDRYQVDLV